MQLSLQSQSHILAGLRMLQLAEELPTDVLNVLTSDGQRRMSTIEIDALIADLSKPALPKNAHRELLHAFDARFGAAFDRDDEIDGGDAVDWICEFLPTVRSTLLQRDPIPTVVITGERINPDSVLSDMPINVIAADFDCGDFEVTGSVALVVKSGAGLQGEAVHALLHVPSHHVDVNWVRDVASRITLQPMPPIEINRDLASESLSLLEATVSAVRELADGWPSRELSMPVSEIEAKGADLISRLRASTGDTTQRCGHSVCSQFYIDTGSAECIKAESDMPPVPNAA